MNERVKELANEHFCRIEYDSGYVHECYEFSEQELEKFAKLIAAECMKIAIFKDSGTISTAEVAGYMAAGRSTAARLIKEHFEVE